MSTSALLPRLARCLLIASAGFATAILMASCGPMAIRTAPPPQAPPPAAVPADSMTAADLIRRLADDRYAVREQATARLIDMGAEAIPIVRARMRQRPLDPETESRLRIVLEALDPAEAILAGRFRQFGWAAGAANDGNPDKESYFKILAATRSGSGITVSYDWQNGVMELQQENQTLVGTWRQDNGAGAVEITFGPAGKFIAARWNDVSSPDHWEKAVLR